MDSALRDFLEIPYDQLEEMNLEAKAARANRTPAHEVQEQRLKYLTDEKRIKAVTVCFSDLEGRLHMLDYDKKFLLKSADNLTFDGSSVRGFSQQSESDLRLAIDWPAFYWLPSDIFGPGKVLVFADVLERDGSPLPLGASRALCGAYTDSLWNQDKTIVHASNEIEGFLFRGKDAERRYYETGKFEFISTGGYYHSLPGDELRRFIDTSAEVQRAMGFANEKDHPEVAPSQFEMNYSYTEANIAADQVLLYKLICRQVAQKLDMSASLPPETGHRRERERDAPQHVPREGTERTCSMTRRERTDSARRGWDMIDRILTSGQELCLILNPSVNAYRRLDPHFEAPNQIKASAINRGAMVRIPLGNDKTARIEVRSIAPDANPHMAIYTLLRTGLEGPLPPEEENGENKRSRTRFLPDNIHDAIRLFKQSPEIAGLLGEEVQRKFAEAKQASADRCPKALGSVIKAAEIQFHHEVTNQYLWSMF